VSSVNLAGLDHVVSVSASQEGKVTISCASTTFRRLSPACLPKIYFRVYMVRLKKSGTRLPRVELEEMGPSVDFEVRRFQNASKEVMHEALKVPRTLKASFIHNNLAPLP